jgi:PncC family amidohydrolase
LLQACRYLYIFARSNALDKPLEVQAGELLRQKGLRLATAESCTGGLVSHMITNVAGSSTYYVGGVTAYAYEAKVRLLGVSWETLEKYGAVSSETVLEMAQGARIVMAADIGVAVSGIAGPGGGMPGKPVGTVWIGLSSAKRDVARHHLFLGDRLSVKEQSAQAALGLLVEFLQESKDT